MKEATKEQSSTNSNIISKRLWDMEVARRQGKLKEWQEENRYDKPITADDLF